MKIKPDWLRTDPLQFILGELNAGGEAYCVGGCVRDAVMGLPVNDIDIATNRTPSEVEKVFTDWDHVKLLPTGVEHGTWTVMIEGEAFEVTSYRKDVTTDGRNATVEFASSMKEDAQRRDFTMNALYMDWQGNVIDPTGQGLTDIMSRTVRFVGDANERCREDYLRILRLFRFHAKYGKGLMDNDAYWAAYHNSAGLVKVSGERKWDELKKLLTQHDPMDALHMMEKSEVLRALLPDAGHVLNVADVISVERQAAMAPGWERRLVALMSYDEDDVQMPFPVANSEQNYLTKLAQLHPKARIPAHAAFLLKDEHAARDCFVLVIALERGMWINPQSSIDRGMNAVCPVTAQDYMDQGVEPGPELGACIRGANTLFLASDLMATKTEIMERA